MTATLRDDMTIEEIVDFAKAAREQNAGEAAARISLALLVAVLEYHDSDPHLGALLMKRLAVAVEDQPSQVVDIVRIAATAVCQRTGCAMPGRFASN